MDFKITSGGKLVAALELNHKLSLLYQSDFLIIEGESSASVKLTFNDKTIILIGNVIGWRDKSGVLKSIDVIQNYLKYILDIGDYVNSSLKLEGRYILIVIESNGVCKVCSDRFAKLDTYLQKDNSGVVLASNLSLLPEPEREGYDQAGLAHTLTYYGYRPPKRHTLYKSVARLGVGDSVVLDKGKYTVESISFSPIPVAEYTEREHTEYSDIFLNHLKLAGSSEGNIVYLSSGWDSTSILAGLIHTFGNRKVRAVIGRMRYSERSGVCNQFEIDRAKKFADYYNIKLDTVDLEFIENGPEDVAEQASLMRDHQLYSLTMLSHGNLAKKVSEISNGNEAIFAGEISDGAHNFGFSQYATIFHPVHDFREYSDKMASYLFGPTFISLLLNGEHEQDPIYSLFRSRHNGIKLDKVDKEPSKRISQMLTSFFLRNGRFPLWSLENTNSLTDFGRKKYTDEMFNAYLADSANQAKPENIYSLYLHLYNSFHWQGSTVQTLSILADKYNLKSDLPFWSSGLQEFLSSMPENWGRGLDLNSTKFPLKWMLKNRIDYPYDYQKGPHSYTYDVEHDFNHAVEVFYHSKMKDVYQAALKDKSYHQLLSPEYFDLDYYDSLVDKYINDEVLSGDKFNDLIPLAFLCHIGWYGKQ